MSGSGNALGDMLDDGLPVALDEERRVAGLFYPIDGRRFRDGERAAAVDASRGVAVDARGRKVVALAGEGRTFVAPAPAIVDMSEPRPLTAAGKRAGWGR